MERKGCESIGCWTHFVTLSYDLDLGFSRSNFKMTIPGMAGPIDTGQKRCELIGCWTHIVTLNFDLTHVLDLGISRSNFVEAVSQECEGRLTWKERDVSR